MKLRLEMPSFRDSPIGLERMKRYDLEYKIVRWCKDIGDEIDYGNVLVDLAISNSEFTAKALEKPLWWVETAHSVFSKEDSPIIQIIANDQGILKEIFTPMGSSVKTGDQLALVVTKDEFRNKGDSTGTGESKFRVVASLRDNIGLL